MIPDFTADGVGSSLSGISVGDSEEVTGPMTSTVSGATKYEGFVAAGFGV